MKQMATVINSFAIAGIDGYRVEAETVTMYGHPSVTIVGLGDTAIKESRQRLEAAITYAGYEFPKMKIAINLAPGDIKKSGSHFNLPIGRYGVLLQVGLHKQEPHQYQQGLKKDNSLIFLHDYDRQLDYLKSRIREFWIRKYMPYRDILLDQLLFFLKYSI